MRAERILIFNVNWLGDVLFSTAVIRNVRKSYPESFIACVAPERCHPVLEGNPYLDEFIAFDERGSHANILTQLKFIGLLRNKRFDTVFLLHRSFSRALICYLAGIPHRIGHYTKKRAFLLTKNIAPPEENSVHRMDYYLDVIEKAGVRIEDRHTEFFVTEADEKSVEDFLAGNSVAKDDFLVVLNPGGNWLPKRWPKEYWADLADKLIKERGAKVVLTGAQKDIALAADIKALMVSLPITACGVFSLKQLGALTKRAELFITADSGPLHVASACGAKKIIALFGPTDTRVTAPRPADNVIILQKDVGCRIPCYEINCKDNRCMKAISPDCVLERVNKARRDKK